MAYPPPIPPNNKRLPTKPYDAPSRPQSIDDYRDPTHNVHARVRDMFGSEPPPSGIRRANTTPHQPHGGYVNQRALAPVEEIPRYHPVQWSTQPSAAFSPPPSDREMDRLERYATLLERFGARKGHEYGTLEVSEGARALRGDVFSDKNFVEASMMSASHNYGNAKAVGTKSLIVDGNMGSKDFGDFSSGRTDADHYGQRRESNRRDS